MPPLPRGGLAGANHLALSFAELALAFEPLLAFATHLLRAPIEGGHRYGALALFYVRLFRAKWIDQGPDPSVLGAQDVQSLADLGQAYQVVRETGLFPFYARDVALLFVLISAPMLPLAPTVAPLTTLLGRALKALLGGEL